MERVANNYNGVTRMDGGRSDYCYVIERLGSLKQGQIIDFVSGHCAQYATGLARKISAYIAYASIDYMIVRNDVAGRAHKETGAGAFYGFRGF